VVWKGFVFAVPFIAHQLTHSLARASVAALVIQDLVSAQCFCAYANSVYRCLHATLRRHHTIALESAPLLTLHIHELMLGCVRWADGPCCQL
jgi:hypothetical protein